MSDLIRPCHALRRPICRTDRRKSSNALFARGYEGKPGELRVACAHKATRKEFQAPETLSRRKLGSAAFVLGFTSLPAADSAFAESGLPNVMQSVAGSLVGNGFDLETVLGPGNPSIRSPGQSWSTRKRTKQIFYPSWMEGTWDVTAEFAGFYAPLGQRFANASTPGFTKASILAVADIGATPVRYKARYVYSQEEGGVVADRIYNIAQCVDAFLARPGSIRSVEYDPLSDPTRLQAVYSTPRKDTRGISEDLRKAEIFINNRFSMTRGEAGLEFLCAEYTRQVAQAVKSGAVNDYVVATKMRQTSDNSVEGLQRIGAFLQPQDPAYFDVGGQAVAVYNYALHFSRIL